MGVLEIAFGKPKKDGKDGEEPSSQDMGDEGDDAAPSKEEVAAFGELRSALSSADDEMGATALKNFIKACGY